MAAASAGRRAAIARCWSLTFAGTPWAENSLQLLSMLDTHPRVIGAFGSAQLNIRTGSIEVGRSSECAGVAVLLCILPAAFISVAADHLHMDWTSGRRHSRGRRGSDVS